MSNARSHRHITIHMEDELSERLIRAAQNEEMLLSPFVRKLTRWAMQHYEKHGSLHGLSQSLPAKRPRGVKSRRT